MNTENLLKIENKEGTQVVDSRLIAGGLNIKHKNLMETIRKYQTDLKDLGILPFETEKLDTGRGRSESFCYLNELQCNFLVTLSRNTPEVVTFKKSLVISFDKVKKEVQVLEEVLKESEDFLEKKRKYYKKKGYSDNWIQERLKSLEVRSDLEALWRKSGVDKPRQFAVLTGIISKGVFGITPSEHKRLKSLKHQSLRDNMTLRELVFMSLAEVSTQDFAEKEAAENYQEHKEAAQKGGSLAGRHVALYEKETGKKVVSSLNFLPENRHKYLKK